MSDLIYEHFFGEYRAHGLINEIGNRLMVGNLFATVYQLKDTRRHI